MNENSGIYQIRNIKNNKLYVGNSSDLKKRFREHLHLLKSNKHNAKLQNSFNKHGESSFVFEIIEYVEGTELLVEREQFWIDKLDVFKIGYNMSPTAGSTKGVRWNHTDEAKEKMSKSKIGNKHGQGIIFSEERKKRISKALTGVSREPTYGMLGKKHNPDTLLKMKKAQENRRLRDSKLSEENAKDILNTKQYHGYIVDLSKKFNVSVDVIRSVINKKTFKHLSKVSNDN